jgi:4-hydroxy-3-polyprenylbenzoate decarboxylase
MLHAQRWRPVAHGLSDNLIITRGRCGAQGTSPAGADGARVASCSLIHLRNMVSATEMPAPSSARPCRPSTCARKPWTTSWTASVARVLDLLDVPHTLAARWEGLAAP